MEKITQEPFAGKILKGAVPEKQPGRTVLEAAGKMWYTLSINMGACAPQAEVTEDNPWPAEKRTTATRAFPP
ncbi:hypothetical protein [Dysosmobacter sp.]|uniref:hypothetical protein n=1 Tax=Dysosmobacter sp. TaxID=2591382 RepID=UPI002D8086A8|nr:hypothetical protein [Dysosmobacter sp.]